MRISAIKFIFGICTFSIVSFFAMVIIASQAPKDFPEGQFDFNVPKDSSITYVSTKLYEKNIISSPFLFKLITVIGGDKKGLFAGDYRFTESQNTISIASRMMSGKQGLPKIKITIPEGTNVSEMAYIYMTKLTNFNAPKFVALARKEEGYLFPDTYNFLSNAKPEEVIKEMRANFDRKTSAIKAEIARTNYTMKQIIIMASLIEEEARGLEDKKMVSGILWNRFEDGMLLQVDAPFYYITGKNSGVTYDDLKIDSPYNTYKYKGLPVGPISNPGLESIIAAIKPTSTKYYYYLTGKDGVMRYSITYNGHLKNKNIYLN